MPPSAPVPNPRHGKSLRIAWWLVVPSSAILLAAVCLIPWMLDKRRQLQNEYWENQLLLAMIAAAIGALSFPALMVILTSRRSTVRRRAWSLFIGSYLVLAFYMAQSHFAIVAKVLYLSLAMAVIILGFKARTLEEPAAPPVGADGIHRGDYMNK